MCHCPLIKVPERDATLDFLAEIDGHKNIRGASLMSLN